MISFISRGSFSNMERYLRGLKRLNVRSVLESSGKEGVRALSEATPKNSGIAASSWDYTIKETRTGISVIWTNNDVESGFPVVIMLQYGYGTGNGGYVQGRDFINPAMKPVFDRIANDVEKAVKLA